MFDLGEILNYLHTNFPMCKWAIVPKHWEKGQMIMWKPTDRFIVEIYPMELKSGHGIIMHWDNKKELSGGGYPSTSIEELGKSARYVIKQFNPKLLEETQLTLF